MNIKDAKQQIKNASMAYFTKNEFGDYAIPIERQRPVFLMGPPGIGKTAVMEQIAQELGVALVSYSMTHHTRQSALGLPFITHKTFGEKEHEVSEYTMSEIISSVYDMMEETGLSEGILFMDEINCVSETLAPAMLLFLQKKTFGRHRVPDGWIVVTAGNPPEYNNSVREFDIATWDRLKRVDVEPDYAVWKEYGSQIGVHPAIMTYLEIKRTDFYIIESTVDGKRFVTARGWIDLSDMIKLYEQKGIAVDEKLVSQYLQNAKIAKSFAIYYDLFVKYRNDYNVEAILGGEVRESIKKSAKKAKFDERLALMGILIDAVAAEARSICERDESVKLLAESLGGIQEGLMKGGSANEQIMIAANKLQAKAEAGKKSSSMAEDAIRVMKRATEALYKMNPALSSAKPADPKAAFKAVKAEFDKHVAKIKKDAKEVTAHLDNIFSFCEEVFPDGQELLILVTELTARKHTSSFILRYGCESYFKHNKDLMFHERRLDIIEKLEGLDEID
ncbi:MAG: AAA family ATPase [Clostridiales bacterium]|jgi:hypothetical protein|nr:AAA family ATPase [Clostridiales bacterium]